MASAPSSGVVGGILPEGRTPVEEGILDDRVKNAELADQGGVFKRRGSNLDPVDEVKIQGSVSHVITFVLAMWQRVSNWMQGVNDRVQNIAGELAAARDAQCAAG